MAVNKLKISKNIALAKLEMQITKGSVLGKKGIEFIQNNSNHSAYRSEIDKFKVELEQWIDISESTLYEIYHSLKYGSGFKNHSASKREFVSFDWQPDIRYYLEHELLPKLEYLKILQSNTVDFEEIGKDTDESSAIQEARSEAQKTEPEIAKINMENYVFIGHGHSTVWKDLKDFLQDRLKLKWDEFNRESTAGVPITERLQEMVKNSKFAFIIMTAEDEHSDGNLHARENVVHEAGLFQGKLGFRKAIILIEEGCSEFSNIIGLGQIRFPKDKIESAYEEIRRVLEREKIIEK